jgi:hypothetical protein
LLWNVADLFRRPSFQLFVSLLSMDLRREVGLLVELSGGGARADVQVRQRQPRPGVVSAAVGTGSEHRDGECHDGESAAAMDAGLRVGAHQSDETCAKRVATHHREQGNRDQKER